MRDMNEKSVLRFDSAYVFEIEQNVIVFNLQFPWCLSNCLSPTIWRSSSASSLRSMIETLMATASGDVAEVNEEGGV